MSEVTIKDQASKLLPHAAGFVAARTIELGLELGLIEMLSGAAKGLTSKALAEAAGTDEFYTGVWCRAAYGAEVIEHDEKTQTYTLGAHMQTLLLDRTSPAYVGGIFKVLTEPEIFDAFAKNLPTGDGIWWNDASPDFIAGVAGTGAPFNNRLIPTGLNQIPSATKALESGARVLELACGTGYALARLLEHYPKSSLVGHDGDKFSLELSAKTLAEAGFEGKVELVESTLEDLDFDDEFDVITINVSMHECRDIEKVAANVLRALKPGGTFVISDFPFPETHEGLRTVPARIMSGIQVFEALIGDQLLPTSAFVQLLERHGFSDIAAFDITPVHAITHGRRPE